MPTTLNASVASGTNVVYSWDLGDGQTASSAHLTHTYDAPGVYELTVTAINGTSAEEVATTVSVVEQWSIFLPMLLGP
jgi:PKD repeat protein